MKIGCGSSDKSWRDRKKRKSTTPPGLRQYDSAAFPAWIELRGESYSALTSSASFPLHLYSNYHHLIRYRSLVLLRDRQHTFPILAYISPSYFMVITHLVDRTSVEHVPLDRLASIRMRLDSLSAYTIYPSTIVWARRALRNERIGRSVASPSISASSIRLTAR